MDAINRYLILSLMAWAIIIAFGLYTTQQARAEILNIDQCREAVDAFAKKLSEQERREEAKSMIFDAWNACKADDFELANVKMETAQSFITGEK